MRDCGIFEHLVLGTAALLELRAGPEVRVAEQHPGEVVPAVLDEIRRDIVYGQTHAAGDVHAHGPGDDGAFGGEDAAYGEAVAEVGVWHEGAADGDGEAHGVLHLGGGAGFDQVRAPHAVGPRPVPKLVLGCPAFGIPDVPELAGEGFEGGVRWSVGGGAGLLQLAEDGIPVYAVRLELFGGGEGEAYGRALGPPVRDQVPSGNHRSPLPLRFFRTRRTVRRRRRPR